MKALAPALSLLFAVSSLAAQRAEPLPSLAPLVDQVKSAVINVEVASRASGEDTKDMGELFQWFFGPQGPGRGGGQGSRRLPQQPQYRQGAGSGFIIDARGLALTNNHVVEGAVSIRVKLDDGREFDAKVLGRDPLTDVAVIRLEGDLGTLPSVKLGDSDQARVGDWVVAIGNPFGLASSVSAGILSARARDIHAGPYDDFLQTDAAINPGNSGGPLFNLNGEVVGINTAIVGGGTGIGFAVPSNVVKALLPQLEQTGTVVRGYLGVYAQDLTADLAKALNVPVNKGAVVSQVSPGSPAEHAGLKADDALVALDGQPIDTAGALTRTVAMKKPGTPLAVTLYRGSHKQELSVNVAKRPDLEHAGESPAPGGSDQEVRHRLGVTLQDVDPNTSQPSQPQHGALIAAVEPGSPAERAELQDGMVVVEAGGKPVRSAADLQRVLRGAQKGQVVLLRVALPNADAHLLRALRIP